MSTRLEDENIQNEIIPKNIGDKVIQTYEDTKMGYEKKKRLHINGEPYGGRRMRK